MRSSQKEGADQACPTDQILSSPRIEALGNRLIYLLKVVRVEATPGTFVRHIGSRSDEEEVFQTAAEQNGCYASNLRAIACCVQKNCLQDL
jgi:hypothetical protein